MRRYILLMVLVLAVVTSCEYNDEHFKGLDELTASSDLKILEYTLTDADYTAISNSSINRNLALAVDSATLKELENLKTTQYFSQKLSPAVYLPAFIQSKWFSADNGSAIKISYNNKYDEPEHLASLPNAVGYTVTADDYETVWGSDGIRYFTPAKSFLNSSDAILSAAFPEAEYGDVQVVEYSYSSQEPTGVVNPIATFINEDFESIVVGADAEVNGWVNFSEVGDLLWQSKRYNDNSYIQFSAYSATGEAVAWMISPKVNLVDAVDPKLVFFANIGNYTENCLQVLVSNDFNGDDPTTSTWIDITSNFALYNKGSSYTNFYLAGEASLDEFKENPIYVAFKYSGDKASGKTTTYQVDNVQIGDGIVVNRTPVYVNDFSAGIDDWENLSVQGDKVWKVTEYSGNSRVEYSAHGTTGTQESWLISPSLSVPADGTIQLSLIGAVGYYNSDCISVLVSSDYAGDRATATWVDVTSSFGFPKATSGYSPIVTFGATSLNPFAGESVVVALKYVGGQDLSATTTYQVYDFVVEEVALASPLGVGALKSSVVTHQKYELYTYDGSKWQKSNEVVILDEATYQSMGFKYFSSTHIAENYLPTYLANNFPYAVEDDTKTILYFNGSATTLAADEYVFTAGLWSKNSGLEVEVDQFVKSKDVWVWDPSTVINLPPVRNDEFVMNYYQTAVDWVWENVDVAQLGISTKGEGYVSKYGNNDYYTGCSAYYNNVDLRVGKAREQYAAGYEGLSDDEALALMQEQLVLVMEKVLSTLHSDAKAIEGVEVTYTINLGIYENSSISDVTHTLVYKVVGDGEFVWVSGPTPIEK